MQNNSQAKEERKERTKEARNCMVEENMGLIYLVLRRFSGRGYDMEDLFQIGAVGLLKAAERFDESKEFAFSTYAVPLIIGEIKRFLRDDGMLHVSRQMKEDAKRIAYFSDVWKKEHGAEPTIEDLTRELQMTKEAVLMAVESGYAVESLYRPIAHGNEKEDGELVLMDQIEEKNDGQEQLINALAVAQIMDELDTQSKELIRLRYLQGLTQMQVAKRMGMNQVAVSRMEKKILLHLRKRV